MSEAYYVNKGAGSVTVNGETVAIKAGDATKAYSNFDYASLLTEAFLLGNVAIRAGQPIEWDSEKMTCSNLPAADRFVSKSYRVY